MLLEEAVDFLERVCYLTSNTPLNPLLIEGMWLEHAVHFWKG
jgi:hypothetical protein